MPLPTPHLAATKTERRHVLTGTDAMRIVAGDWRALWQEKRGLAPGADLTHNWKCRLGLVTEGVHAWWHSLTEKTELADTPDRPCRVSGVDLPPHYASTFDRWCIAEDVPLELKHSHARNSLADAAVYYMPQLQWQLIVAGVKRLRFSIICGNDEPDWGYVSADADYQRRLRAQADAFWQAVQSGDEPELDMAASAELAEAAKTIPLNGFKPYDFSRNNQWCVAAARYREIKPLAEEAEVLNKELKELVPADASEVTGAGVRIARNKKGSLVLTIKETSDA